MPSSAPQLATVTVVGKDRTGVIARVTGFLFEHGANIESLEEQVTRGQFYMALQASFRKGVDRSALERDLGALGRQIRMEMRIQWSEPDGVKRMAIFVTKEAHCLEALLAAWTRKRLKAKPVVVIGNHRTLAPIAQRHGIPFKHVPFTDRARAEARALKVVTEYGADFIVLARFMKILSPGFVWRFRNRIINIHPSLLPAFPGASAYRQAYEKGVRVVGVTAHFVTPDLDQGPIIHQDAFRVQPGDALGQIMARGQRLESRVLTEAVRMYLTKRLDVHWGRVWSA